MKLSVILPVYNVAQYVDRCAQSLLQIDSSEVEFIFVNDGSTDNSLELLNSWKKKDRRIKVYSQENSGSGCARNFGFDKSIGEYVYFMDPDDWINDNFFILISPLLNDGYDLIVFGYTTIKKNRRSKSIVNRNIVITDHENFINSIPFIFSNVSIFAVWNKIYKRDLLVKNNILFTSQKTGQDALFNFEVMSYVSSAYVLNRSLYYYDSTRENSARNKTSDYKITDDIIVGDRYEYFCEKNNIQKRMAFEHWIDIFYLYKTEHIDIVKDLFEEKRIKIHQLNKIKTKVKYIVLKLLRY